MANLTNKEFIEIEFTGRTKDGEIFDSNIKEDLKKANLQKALPNVKPFVFCLGQKMFLEPIDKFLIGKEIGKEYEIELTPEKAFGARNPKLIKIIPIKIFREQKLNPLPGMVFNFDNQLAKIISVSGGRVVTDFNNPLAGKIVVYKIKVLRKIEDINEKIKALMEFCFKKEFKFEINEKDNTLVIEVEKQIKPFFELFKDRFKEILGLSLELKDNGVKTEKKELEKEKTPNKEPS